MFRKFLSASLLCILMQNASAQLDSAKLSQGWSYKFSGFVDPQFYMDTREVVSAREEQMLFYPSPKVYDADSNDINDKASNNMLAITARIGLKIDAPSVFNAKVFGYVEGDFTGATNEGINMLRLRHAYINMRWEKSNLLLGQYWHPMVAHEVMPGTRPLNMGVPFHPYSRYVQARYTQYFGKFELSGIASFQLDNKATGPEGGSTAYLRNGCIPELNAQLCYRSQNVLLGAMFNYVALQPRTFTVDKFEQKHKTDKLTTSTALSVFAKINTDQMSIRLQGIRGDNLFEQPMLGGYIESALNDDNEYEYTNFGTTTIWTDISRTKGQWRPGVFAGYGVNHDFGKTVDAGATVYGRGFDIDYLWRIQPRIGYYPTDYLNFFAEVEYTNVCYGKKMLNDDGSYHYESDYNVGNSRFVLAVVFNF